MLYVDDISRFVINPILNSREMFQKCSTSSDVGTEQDAQHSLPIDMYLTISCSNIGCRAIYRAYRVVNPPHSLALINFCMFCGEHTVSITQDMEKDVLDVLANKYNKTPQEISSLLDTFTHLPPTLNLTFHKLASGEN